MKKALLLLYFTTVLSLLVSPCSAEFNKQHYTWFKKHYGELKEADNPLAARAEAVFKRVAAVADKRALRPPKLLVIPVVRDPWAASLADGTILLNKKALERCYHKVDRRAGDSRLAFVIGHELAHLANDDFWSQEALNLIRQFGSGSKAEKEVADLIQRAGGDVNTPQGSQALKDKELHADKYGLLYAAMAGYDSNAVVAGRENNFFKEWAGQTVETDKSHPAPIQRTDFLLTEMEKVKAHIVLFSTGVRLFQAGRYEHAAEFLESFLAEFPSREVHNNIGLAYYQMAMEELAKCGPDKAFRFKSATILDTETRASEYVRGGHDEDCPHRKDFEDKLKQAIENFEKAKANDPFYLPAYINLSSAQIAAGKYSKALAVFEDMEDNLPEAENDPRVQNNQAAANYLKDRTRNKDGGASEINALKRIIKAHPYFADPVYNLARMLQEKGDHNAAKTYWHQFINLESRGAYAALARKAADNLKKQPSDKVASPLADPLPPADLGNCDADIIKLTGTEQEDKLPQKYLPHNLGVKELESLLYSDGRDTILVIEDKIEMLVCPSKPNIRVSGIKSRYGDPNRIFKSVSGMQTSVYRNFAVEAIDDKVKHVVYFDVN